MLEPAFRSLICRIGHRLRVDGGAHDFPVHLQPMGFFSYISSETPISTTLNEVHDVLVHASTCELDLDFVLGEERVYKCKYPRCNNGKILWRHIYFCSGKHCLLCDSMRHIAMFHAGQCTDSNCVIPRCSDFKEKIRQKERKARKDEKRLKRLRKKERELKMMYDMQLSESELAAAAVERGPMSARKSILSPPLLFR